ncbi:MAG: NADPH-dependent FMN reductase [Candidatus Phaeomarinobacter sp.]
MKLLIVLGSLRANSYSRKLAQAVTGLLPDDVSPTIIDGGDLPLYNQDLDGDDKPSSVENLLAQVKAADAMLFITPEYNYGVPGPLKNLIDWASRPAYASPLKDKPALIIAQSIAMAGGARAQLQLSTVLGGTLARIFNGPSFLVSAVHEKFNEEGEMTDEFMTVLLRTVMDEFVRWAAPAND